MYYKNMKKECTKCKLEKNLDDFYVRSNSQTHWGKCKVCVRAERRGEIPRAIDRPVTYKDYLEKANMYGYYKKTLKYQI